MSGRKQHYIPKCLLDGFESPGRGKTIKVFVFKKGQPPYCSSTLDVAASRYFYSELSESDVLSLDDQITLYEGDLGRLLIQLRSAPLNSDIVATIAAEVITHLTLRVAHVRDMCSLVMNQMLTGSADLFSQKKHMRKFLGVDADVLPAHLEEALEKQFCEQEVMLTKLISQNRF